MTLFFDARATDKTHDWRASQRLLELSDRPVILAGGLTPENVKKRFLKSRRPTSPPTSTSKPPRAQEPKKVQKNPFGSV